MDVEPVQGDLKEFAGIPVASCYLVKTVEGVQGPVLLFRQPLSAILYSVAKCSRDGRVPARHAGNVLIRDICYPMGFDLDFTVRRGVAGHKGRVPCARPFQSFYDAFPDGIVCVVDVEGGASQRDKDGKEG